MNRSVRPIVVFTILVVLVAPAIAADSPSRTGDVIIDLGLSREKRESFKTAAESESNFHVLGYSESRGPSGLALTPTLSPFEAFARSLEAPVPADQDHLKLVGSGRPIPTVHHTEYSFEFPALDVKVLNNGTDTLLFTEARIIVERSRPDLAPVVFIESDYDQVQRFVIFNDGWGRIEGGRVRFNLGPLGTRPGHETYAFERRLGPFEDRCEVVITPELASLGVDAAFLGQDDALTKGTERLDRALGPLKSQSTVEEDAVPMPMRSVALSGEANLDWKDAARAAHTTTVRFQGSVLVTPPDGLGAVGPVTGTYDAMLETDRADYTVRVPVTQTAKPGAMTRFVLGLGFARSSHHALRLCLATADGRTFDSPRITVQGLLTRTCVALLEREKQSRESDAVPGEGDPSSADAPAATPPSASSRPTSPNSTPHVDRP